jgi:phage-related protein
MGFKSPAAKPLRGFADAGVLEVVVDFDGNAFRTVYTVRFAKVVYVLHAFQKKSRRAVATPKSELDLIGTRLARAKEDYEAWLKSR